MNTKNNATDESINEVNPVRAAFYQAELKLATTLQTINAGAIIFALNFLYKFAKSTPTKIIFFISILLYFPGLILSIYILRKQPEFIDKRFKRNMTTRTSDECHLITRTMNQFTSFSLSGFILGSLLILSLIIVS